MTKLTFITFASSSISVSTSSFLPSQRRLCIPRVPVPFMRRNGCAVTRQRGALLLSAVQRSPGNTDVDLDSHDLLHSDSNLVDDSDLIVDIVDADDDYNHLSHLSTLASDADDSDEFDDDDDDDVDSFTAEGVNPMAASNFEGQTAIDNSLQNLEEPNVIRENGVTVVDIPPESPIPLRKERARTSALIDAIITEPKRNTSFTADAEDQPDIDDDETFAYVRTAVRAADMRKAEDIVALRVSKLTYITSFIMIVTGNNGPQLRAISNLIEEDVSKQHGLEPRRIEGVPNSGWILIDYGDFMVNVFSSEQRRNYNLEKLWSRAEMLDISNYLVSREEVQAPAMVDADDSDDWLSDQ